MGKSIGKTLGKIPGVGGLVFGGGKIGGAGSPTPAGPSGSLFKTDTSANLAKDFKKGESFGKKLVGDGSLGRLGTDSDIQSIIQQKRELAKGFSGGEFQARRDQASQSINQNTESARRQLAGSQARAGVRGATAGAQQANIVGQGLQQQRQLDQNLLIQDRNAQTQGLQGLESTVGQVRQFDLAQSAKEKFAQLSTGLSFGQFGAAERGAQLSATATTQAAAFSRPQDKGFLGNLSVICTELHRQGLISREQWKLNELFGAMQAPATMIGYRSWAKYVVVGMAKSKLFTKLACLIALPWSNELASIVSKNDKYKSTTLGRIAAKTSVSVSNKLGLLLLKRLVKA